MTFLLVSVVVDIHLMKKKKKFYRFTPPDHHIGFSWFLWLCSYSSLTEVDVYRLKQHGLSLGFCGSSDNHHLLKYAVIVLSHTIFLLVSVVVLILKYMPRRLPLGFIDCVEIHHLMTQKFTVLRQMFGFGLGVCR